MRLLLFLIFFGVTSLSAQHVVFNVKQKPDTAYFNLGYLKATGFNIYNNMIAHKDSIIAHPEIAVKLKDDNTLYRVLSFTICYAYTGADKVNVYEVANNVVGNRIYLELLNRIRIIDSPIGLSYSSIRFAYKDSIGVLKGINLSLTDK
jgi:hypothetical protein